MVLSQVCEYLAAEEGFEVTYLPVSSEGLVEIERLRAAIKPTTVISLRSTCPFGCNRDHQMRVLMHDPGVQVLVAIMTANNEVGAVQDMASVVAAVKKTNPRALVFTDASQAVGKIPVDVTASQVFHKYTLTHELILSSLPRWTC